MSVSASALVRPEQQQRPLKDAGPILKWAGGKTRILKHLLPRMPASFERYLEPFVGGGALYFATQPDEAVLADVNAELINAYEVTRDQVDDLIADLKNHRYERDHYYRVRGTDPNTLSRVARASRMIFLNRTCFNGLYRVNRRGQFNVPIGRYTNPTICQEDRLRAASLALRGATFALGDFRATCAEARFGDFVYFDPPYDPVSRTANFTSYTAGAFGPAEQSSLAAECRSLDERGVRFLLSNSDTPFIRELYEGFHIDFIEAPRAISRNGAGRKAAREVLVRNY